MSIISDFKELKNLNKLYQEIDKLINKLSLQLKELEKRINIASEVTHIYKNHGLQIIEKPWGKEKAFYLSLIPFCRKHVFIYGGNNEYALRVHSIEDQCKYGGYYFPTRFTLNEVLFLGKEFLISKSFDEFCSKYKKELKCN